MQTQQDFPKNLTMKQFTTKIVVAQKRQLIRILDARTKFTKKSV